MHFAPSLPACPLIHKLSVLTGMYIPLKYPISLTSLQQTFTLFPEFKFDLRGFQFGHVEEIQ
jgi:hypothetical protein